MRETTTVDRIGGPIRIAVRLAQSLLECGSLNPSDTLGHRTKRNPKPCQPPATSPF